MHAKGNRERGEREKGGQKESALTDNRPCKERQTYARQINPQRERQRYRETFINT